MADRGIEVNSLYCKSCGSEAKCVNALILNFSRILSQTEGKKEELRNQVLNFLQKHKITVYSVAS